MPLSHTYTHIHIESSKNAKLYVSFSLPNSISKGEKWLQKWFTFKCKTTIADHKRGKKNVPVH